VSELWIVEMPSDELAQDLEEWQKAGKIIDGFAKAFAEGQSNEAAFVALIDARVRIRRYVERLQEEASQPKAESPPQEQPLCQAGMSTENPCPRPATEGGFFGEDEPTLCPEHARLHELSEDVDVWHLAVEKLDGWVSEIKADDAWGYDELERLLINTRDEARTRYAGAVAAARCAEKAARPKEAVSGALTRNQSERLAGLINDADSFVDARTLVEDTPPEVLLRRDRWVMVDALDRAANAANEEVERYKEEIGLK
jgi:predicted DNA-binding WGR domain protein